MQFQHKPTWRMHVYYWKSMWRFFWRPQLLSYLKPVKTLVERLWGRLRPSWKLPTISLPKLTRVQTTLVMSGLWILALVVVPAVIPQGPAFAETDIHVQRLRAADYVPTLSRGPALYTPHMIYPVGRVQIASPFGWRPAPCSGCSSDHDGVDFHVAYGTPIQAALGGTVTFVGWKGGYGYHIVIDDGYGFVMYYAHMIDGSVPAGIGVGSHVNTGDLIGYVGCTGACTGAHLHFGIQDTGTFVDPLPVLDRYAN